MLRGAVVAAQNELTESVLEECDTREKFKAMMTEMYDFPKVSCPFQKGEPGGVLRCACDHQRLLGNSILERFCSFLKHQSRCTWQQMHLLPVRWYYSSNTGLQAQSVVYTQLTPDSPATVLLDPNTFSIDGTVALSDFTFSWDGSLVAYSIAR